MDSNMTSRRVLVLYLWDDKYQPMRPAIRQHLHVLNASSQRHQVLYHNILLGIPALLRRVRFDAVLLHTTLLCYRWSDYFSQFKESLRWLAHSDALKIALPQDEYDHSEALDEWLTELGVSVVCTNFGEEYRAALYPRLHQRARFLKCLTGYIDEASAALSRAHWRPIAERPLDIVYRANHLPYWFGSHGQLKHEIASIVAERGGEMGLKCNVSTRPEDTIATDAWYTFLCSGKAIIGCESGSSVLDRRGEIQRQIRDLLAQQPDLTFADVARRMPPAWDDYRFFALGPRHLEAVATRTCQVLVEGEYDGVLKPMRHYLPIRRDLGNLNEVLAMIRDHDLLEKIAAQAYEEVYLSGRYSYARFADLLDSVLASASPHFRLTPWSCVRWSYRGALFANRVHQSMPEMKLPTLNLGIRTKLRRVFGQKSHGHE
jgi:hypothetical protein